MPDNEDSNRTGELRELRADVRHLQSDVTELKSELRCVNQRIDSLRDGLILRMDSGFSELRKETADLRKDMVNEFKSVRASLAKAQIWALMLYILLAAGLLGVMAHGFKWI